MKEENNIEIIKTMKNMNDWWNEKKSKRIIDTLEAQEKNKQKNILYTALEQLEDPEQIREFFKEYAQTLTSIEEKEKEAVARDNIVFAIGYYSDDKLLKRWNDALWVLPDHLIVTIRNGNNLAKKNV